MESPFEIKAELQRFFGAAPTTPFPHLLTARLIARPALHIRDSCQCPALQQIERSAREGPLEILSPAKGSLAPRRKRVQLAKLHVVETERVHALGMNFGFLRSASRQEANSD